MLLNKDLLSKRIRVTYLFPLSWPEHSKHFENSSLIWSLTHDVTLISSAISIYMVLHESNLCEYGILFSVWDLIHLIMWKQENNVLTFQRSNIWKDQILILKDHNKTHRQFPLFNQYTYLKISGLEHLVMIMPLSSSFTVTNWILVSFYYNIFLKFQNTICAKYST